MSEFLKFAFEYLSAIVYNIAEVFASILRLFITGIPEYASVVVSYFGDLNIIGKILAILLVIISIVIPVGVIVLLVRWAMIKKRLREENGDNVELYKEIGRLNRQVLDLIDEKNKILEMKASGADGYIGASGLFDAPDGGSVNGAAEISGGPVTIETEEESFANAAVAAATAIDKARRQAELAQQVQSSRFPKLTLVDQKYLDYQQPVWDNQITLEEFVEQYRKFAASQMHLYYNMEIIRRFVAGMAASRLLILEGISGTGKTSLPYSFSRFLNNPAALVSVQPSFRDRTELLGYFNEFSKRFNETEFLRALYEADYREDPSFIVLDEMNLARIEYYFAEMLSVLEMPSHDEWIVDLVPTQWEGDPKLIKNGKIIVSDHLWFVGTANNDDSTFTITDKVYDRAIPIEINERADAFECEETPQCFVTCEHLEEMFLRAKVEHPISDDTLEKMNKLNQYLMTRFKLSFGNRIIKQMYDFIPVYVACGGTELGGMDYIVARKVLKKFESMNIGFVRDEIKGLISYMEKLFGKSEMKDSRDYLIRIQNMY